MTSKTNSWWKLKFISALIPIPLSIRSPMTIFPLFLSLSVCGFFFLVKSVTIKGLILFLVVAIVVNRPICMSEDLFYAGFFKSFVFFTARKKWKLFFFNLLYLCYAIYLHRKIYLKVLSLNKKMKKIIRFFNCYSLKIRHINLKDHNKVIIHM